MIIPQHYEDKLAANPALKSLVDHFPVSFFGHFVKYPKQAHIIKTWLEVLPKICVVTGWKRCAKTAIPAFLGTCWLTGKLDAQWPAAKAMGITKNYIWNRKFNGERVGIIAGSSLDHVENVLLKMYYALIPPSMVKERFSKTNKRIELHDKSKFLVRTYEQDLESWKSGNSQFTHLDEECPWEVMSEVLSRSVSLNGKIFLTLALDDADTSWLPEACANPKKIFGTDSFLHFKLGVEDVPNEIYPENEKQRTYLQYDDTPLRNAVRKGDWAHQSGRWWRNFDPAIHVVPSFPIPQHWLKWRFIDAGFSAPTACSWIAMHPKGDAFVYREYYERERTISQRSTDIITASGNKRQKDGDIFIELETNEKYVLTQLDYHEFKRDAITGDDLSYHYIQAGLPVQPSTTLGQEARREIINKWLFVDRTRKHFTTHELGAPKLYIMDCCPNLIHEAQTKSVKKEANSRAGISERKIDNNADHLLDTCEYACAELEHWCNDYERNKVLNV